jgi:NAD(P)-dependent dehydrogenase (short-subunit alcohol dehydrogenase family)
MLKEIETSFGRLHILVNNAGVAPKERKDILEATEESFVH